MTVLSVLYQTMPARQLKKDTETISSMFDSIAPTYDRLNHILSFGIDRSWRRRLVKKVVGSVQGNGSVKVLDVACGTGDVSMALKRQGMDVTGADISEKMLDIARVKAPDIEFVYGNAAGLPFGDGTFDCVTIAFGIRNFDMRSQCIRELRRVLKDGGILAIVEFSIPRNRLWRGLYTMYFKHVLPTIGRVISRQAYAYTYLPESSFDFPAPAMFSRELEEGGFHCGVHDRRSRLSVYWEEIVYVVPEFLADIHISAVCAEHSDCRIFVDKADFQQEGSGEDSLVGPGDDASALYRYPAVFLLWPQLPERQDVQP